jgi:two-component system, cell cycle response regulator
MHPVHTFPPPPRGATRLLLVCEPTEAVRVVIAALVGEGYEVEVTHGADGLLERVQDAPPDLLLLCIPTPGADWVDLCGDLRTLDQARLVPIMLLASDASSEVTVVHGLEAGADDFIADLTRLDELKARVRVQLRHRRDRELLKWASAQRAQFRSEALLDPLTGIGNRRAAEEGLARALELGEPFLLMLLDVDHFKAVNDTHGHAAGDVVLKALAGALDRLARRGDVVARYGGEEFLLVLRGVGGETAHRVAQRFRQEIAALDIAERADVPSVTASIGAVTCPGGGAPPSQGHLLQRADEALYAAKRAGRNRVVIAQVDQDQNGFQVA